MLLSVSSKQIATSRRRFCTRQQLQPAQPWWRQRRRAAVAVGATAATSTIVLSGFAPDEVECLHANRAAIWPDADVRLMPVAGSLLGVRVDGLAAGAGADQQQQQLQQHQRQHQPHRAATHRQAAWSVRSETLPLY